MPPEKNYRFCVQGKRNLTPVSLIFPVRMDGNASRKLLVQRANELNQTRAAKGLKPIVAAKEYRGHKPTGNVIFLRGEEA